MVILKGDAVSDADLFSLLSLFFVQADSEMFRTREGTDAVL